MMMRLWPRRRAQLIVADDAQRSLRADLVISRVDDLHAELELTLDRLRKVTARLEARAREHTSR